MSRRKRTSNAAKAQRGRDGAIELPVIGASSGYADKQTIRRSKMAPRRAAVLAVVQLLIIAHIIQWWIMGRSTTPIEPSEAMEFSKQGVINAGLIFFALALLSTLVLGRWFCGWGCHVVMLQDLCSWMMKKMGVRPKAFRSRLLMWVPLLLGLYMFVWPAFYRFVILPWRDVPAPSPWSPRLELMTDNFWATFPGLMVAIPFLLICGFATVYFLGSKGFCTYGCPYGGFFAPLDEYSPARIRVTDACEQCGHCTAVCSSNVRVHDEVREYGMVVDPGCMKCMDCVSVCPNDALYFGFGKTAANKGQPRTKAPQRKFDLSMPEEFAIAGVFTVVFFSFRGDYAWFPLLMAAGVAMVLTWIIWKAWRLTRDANANLHRHQLKLRGKLKPAGFVVIASSIVISLGVLHSGLVNAMTGIAGWHDGKITLQPHELLAMGRQHMNEADIKHAESSLLWYSRAYSLAGGRHTFSTMWRDVVHMRMARLHLVHGDFERAEQTLRAVLETSDEQMRRHLVRSLAAVLAAQPQRGDDAVRVYRELLVEWPTEQAGIVLDEFMAWVDHAGRTDEAHDILEQRIAQFPEDSHAMRWLALLLLDRGEFRDGIAMLEQVVRLNPQDDVAQELLQMARQRQ